MLDGTVATYIKLVNYNTQRDDFLQLNVMFLGKYKEKHFFFFCGFNILTGVFVIKLSSNVGISVRQIVWFTTYSCFMSDVRATEM